MLDPKNSRLNGNLGDKYYKDEEYEKALDYFVRAIKISQKHGEKPNTYILNSIVDIYIKLKEYKKALYYLDLIPYEYGHTNLYYEKGLCLYHIGDYEEAKENLEVHLRHLLEYKKNRTDDMERIEERHKELTFMLDDINKNLEL